MEKQEEAGDFFNATQNFLTWLKKQGATVNDKIRIVDFRNLDKGRAVIAHENVAEDEVLFTIPRQSILTVESSSLQADIRSEISDPWLALILVMVYEYQLGERSAWKPYFDVLPEHFDTLMFWSEVELSWLTGAAVVNKVGKESADATFKEQIVPVIRARTDVFNANMLDDEDLLRLCHRMGSIIMAYAFDIEKPGSEQETGEDGWEEDDEENQSAQKGMVPMADLLNADGDKNNAKLFYEENKVVMRSIKPILAGEEIFNDYGPLPTADLVRRYGYVTPNYAQHDVVEVSLDLIKDSGLPTTSINSKEVDRRAEYLDEQGVLDDGYDIGRASDDEHDQFPEELCIVLNTLTLSSEDFATLQRKSRLPKPTPSEAAASLLTVVINKRLSMYPTSAPVNGNLNESSAKRKAMAEQIITGEKQVLREALQTLQNRYQAASGAEKRTINAEAPANKKLKTG